MKRLSRPRGSLLGRTLHELLEPRCLLVAEPVAVTNDLPVPGEDQYSLPSSEPFVVTARQGVLANDFDNEGTALTAILIESPRYGIVELATDGSFTYEPQPGFVGSDRFMYRVSNVAGGHAEATVRLRVASEQVMISEFAAANTGVVRDYFDESSDWIELRNQGSAAVDLLGWYITDDLANLTKWQVPVTSILGSDQHLLVFASGRDLVTNNGELHTNFRLSAVGEELALVHPDGKTIAWTPAERISAQFRNITFGNAPSTKIYPLISATAHSRVSVPIDGLLGNAWTQPDLDDSDWQIHGKGLGFAEQEPDQIASGFTVRMVDLDGAKGGTIESAEAAANVLSGDFDPAEFIFDLDMTTLEPDIHFGSKSLTFSDPRPYPNGVASSSLSDMVISAQTNVTIPAGDWSIGFGSAKGGRLRLADVSFLETFNEDGTTASGDGELLFNGSRRFEWTWGTFSIGPGGLTTTFDSLFFERAGFDSYDVAIAAGHQQDKPSEETWTLLQDGALGWQLLTNFTPPIAIFANLVQSDLAPQMYGRSTSAYVRIPFEVVDPQQFDRLILAVQQDDAFVGYLNGHEVARDNLTGTPAWDSVADEDFPDDAKPQVQSFDISQHLALLKPGENMLALHGINADLADGGFLLIPELTAFKDLASAPVFMEQPTPAEANLPGFRSVLSPPAFSRQGGLTDGTTSLELNHESSHVNVRYTLDGTIPDTDSLLYSDPIKIVGTTQVRARAFSPNHIASQTVSELYVVLSADARGFTSNLPILVLDTYQNPVPGTHTTIRADTAVLLFDLNADGQSSFANEPDLVSRAGIRARGSSSGGFAKVPMSMELRRDDSDDDRNIALVGMPAESDWILQGPFEFDRSHNRNSLIFELSNQIGQYAARTRFVELFLNRDDGQLSEADNFGVYVLMEKLKSGPDRINVGSAFFNATEGPELTGGYIVKIDRRDPGDAGFTAGGVDLSYVEPDEIDIVQRPEQVAYLTQYLEEFGDALREIGFVHPTLGSHYTDYIDEQSWVDHYMLNELMLNVDALRLSSYLYKPRNAELIAGPIWDFDRSADSRDGRDNRPTIWYQDIQAVPWWWERIFDDLEFRQAYIDRWQELRSGPFSTENVHGVIDRMASEVGEAADRNFERWSQVAPRTESNFDSGLLDGTFNGEVQHQKEWLRQRVEYFDSQFLRQPALSSSEGKFPESVTIDLVPIEGTLLYFTVDGSDPRLPGGAINPQAELAGQVAKYVSAESAATVLIPTGAATEAGWQEPGFEDSSWPSAQAAIGFDTGANEFISVESGFTVRQAHSTKRIRNLEDAEDVLAGINVESETIASYVSVLNYKGLGGDGHFYENVSFPDGDNSDFGLVATTTIIVEQPGTYTFGVNSDDGSRLRIDGEEVILDTRRHRARDIFGTIELTAGSHELELLMFQTGGTAALELFAAPGEWTEFDEKFALVGDDLSVSYAPQFNTDVRPMMHDINATAYVRVPFTVSNTSDIRRLFLTVQYDDAFVAFINGVEALRVNAPDELTHNSMAIDIRADSVATQQRSFEITELAHLLREGNNLLALQGLNAAADNPDFLLVPELSAFVVPDSFSLTLSKDTQLVMRSFDPTYNVPDISSFDVASDDYESWSGPISAEFRFFATSPAESLRITEMHYNPEDVDNLEFIELKNVNDSSTLDLTGVRIVGPFDQAFDFGTSQITTLGPQEFVLVVRDQDAFATAYPEQSAIVAGQYSGALSNGGEQLALVGRDEQTILQFTYDDAWHPSTDGTGPSLEIIDVTSRDLSLWNKPSGWRPSARPGGNPGNSRIVGDVDGNGLVNVRDIELLQAEIVAGSSRVRFDLTGDGSVNDDDLVQLVVGTLKTQFGDVNLDGRVDQADFEILAANFGRNVFGWSSGDFDGNHKTSFHDFVELSNRFGFNAG